MFNISFRKFKWFWFFNEILYTYTTVSLYNNKFVQNECTWYNNSKTRVFVFGSSTAGTVQYRSTSYNCRGAEKHEWKEYLRTHRLEEHFVPHFRLSCTNSSRWFRLRQATRVYTRIYRSCVPPLARIYT